MRLKVFPLLALAAALTACGGGGDGDAPAPTPPAPAPAAHPMSGAWQGQSADGSSLNALVLDDGKLWLVGILRGGPSAQAHASLQASAGRFQSSDVRYADYSTGLLYTGTLEGTYATGSSISANLTLGGAPAGSYGLTPIPKATFDYDRAASLGDISGAWASGSTQILVSANGTFQSLDSNGCRNTGTVQPHSSQKNVFTLSVTIGAAPCTFTGQRLEGIAVTWSEGGKPVLLATMLNNGGSMTLVGMRP